MDGRDEGHTAPQRHVRAQPCRAADGSDLAGCSCPVAVAGKLSLVVGAVCGTVAALARAKISTSPQPQVVSLMGNWGPRQAAAFSHGFTNCRMKGLLRCSHANCSFTIQRRTWCRELGERSSQVTQWVMGQSGFPTPTPVLFLLQCPPWV